MGEMQLLKVSEDICENKLEMMTTDWEYLSALLTGVPDTNNQPLVDDATCKEMLKELGAKSLSNAKELLKGFLQNGCMALNVVWLMAICYLPLRPPNQPVRELEVMLTPTLELLR